MLGNSKFQASQFNSKEDTRVECLWITSEKDSVISQSAEVIGTSTTAHVPEITANQEAHALPSLMCGKTQLLLSMVIL